jgi:endonuclease/exonuclease/phosphatase family metal-dependent hydrolase
MFTAFLISRTTNAAMPRRSGLAIALAALSAALAVTTLTPAPVLANAAPVSAPQAQLKIATPVVVPGRDRVTASWGAVPGATGYQVRVSTAKRLIATVSTTSTTAVVSKLKKTTAYYVQVIAVPGVAAAASAVVKTKTTTAYSSKPVITSVTPDGLNTIKVTWTRVSPATSLDIRLSWDNLPLTANQKSRYTLFTFPATATSASLPIPAAYVGTIGSTTGNAAYVRLIAHNGSRERRSTVAYGWPGSLPAVGTALKVATFNVASVAARPAGAFSWSSKRESVANAIKLAAPDVLLTQELIPNPAWSGTSLTQLEDLSNLLGGSGLQLAYSADRVKAIRYGSRGNHIFVRSDQIKVINAGLVASSDLVSADWSKLENRYFAWALLQVRATGEYFYVASVHLLNQDGTTSRKNLRLALISAMDTYLAGLNQENYPVVIGGDFNVGALGAYDAPQTLLSRGYFDTASANWRVNAKFNTTNPTFASRPRYHKYPESRIDYLFAKNTNGAGPTAYVNQLILNSNGSINSNYYGSDHNLQWATITLGGRG